jgi:hypothetical protein
MTGHVQSASGKFLVLPVTVFTAIWFPVGVQVEAAQSAKYPLHVWKSKTLSGPAARAVSGANTRSTAVRPNTTFENVLPLMAIPNPGGPLPRGAPARFFSSDLVTKFRSKISAIIGGKGPLSKPIPAV